MEIAITKMSSKGQVVIPQDQLIMKKASDKGFSEEIEFARRTEEAWKRYDKGKFVDMDFDDFLEEVEKW